MRDDRGELTAFLRLQDNRRTKPYRSQRQQDVSSQFSFSFVLEPFTRHSSMIFLALCVTE
jgi:hypothetical protein